MVVMIKLGMSYLAFCFWEKMKGEEWGRRVGEQKAG